jgi:hypothetical protein
MLAPDDRAVLREQLRPAPGASFDVGIATTFTLDLTAALVAPLAFAAHDVKQSADPVAVLEAVRSVTDRLDIFCQVGQIKVPNTASDLMAFLEPMVHEVEAPAPGYLFHPKIWIVRYREVDGGPSYRLLCCTRNITNDVSWDAFVRLDGWAGGRRPLASNRPLYDLVDALQAMAVRNLPSERADRITNLAKELRRVEWAPPDGMREVTFHALGLRRGRSRPEVLDVLEGRQHLVVSPFLDDEGVAAATSGGQRSTLVSRPEALDRLDPSTLDGLDCRVISPLAGLAQPDDEAGAEVGPSASEPWEASLLGGLHAKIYVVESARQVRILLGSANATSAGLTGGNVEFLVELLGRPKRMAIGRLIGPEAEFASILEPYATDGGVPEPLEETLGRELERHLRRLAARSVTATVERTGDRWSERVHGRHDLDLPPTTRLRVRLLTEEGRSVEQPSGPIEAVFDGLVTADITPFVVLELSAERDSVRVDRSSVVRADLVGDPSGRLDEVIARQVDTPEKFLRFLALLLGLGEGVIPPSNETSGSGASWVFGRLGEAGVFELLVRAVADRPDAIDDLGRLIERLEATSQGRTVLPDGFSELWASVLSARKRLGRSA